MPSPKAPKTHRSHKSKTTTVISIRLPRAWAQAFNITAAAHGIALQDLLRNLLELGLDAAPGELLCPRDSHTRRMTAVQSAVRHAIGAEEQIRISAEWVRERQAQTHPGRPQDLRPHRINPPGARLALRLRAVVDADGLLALPPGTELVEEPGVVPNGLSYRGGAPTH